MHGYGVFHYYNGDFERGIWKEDNFIEGSVKKTYSDGYYEGEFKNEEFNGKGKYYYFDGDYYDGYWINDKFLKGTGRITYDNGYYEGEFYNYKKHGKGKYYFNNGNYFEGKYRFDEIIGDGEERINGVIYKGYYYNGLKEGKFTVIKDGQVDYIEYRNGEEKSKCIIY